MVLDFHQRALLVSLERSGTNVVALPSEVRGFHNILMNETKSLPKTDRADHDFEVTQQTLWDLDVAQTNQGTINDAYDLVEYCRTDETVDISGYQNDGDVDDSLVKTIDVLDYISHDVSSLTAADKTLSKKAMRIIAYHRKQRFTPSPKDLIKRKQERATNLSVEDITIGLLDGLTHIYATEENMDAFAVAAEMGRRYLDRQPEGLAADFKCTESVTTSDILQQQNEMVEMDTKPLGSSLLVALVGEHIRPEKAPVLGLALEVARRWAEFSPNVEQKYRWAGTPWNSEDEKETNKR